MRQCDVGLTLPRIVGRQRVKRQFGLPTHESDDLLSQFKHGEFARVAHVHWTDELTIAVHHPHKAFYQVVYIAKRAGLLPVSVDADVLTFDRLDNEVAYHPAIIRMHPRTVGVEDANNDGVSIFAAVEVGKQSLAKALSFVINTAGTNWIYVAPVTFALWVFMWVAIDL